MQGQWIPAAFLAATATPLSAQTASPVEQAEALPDLAVPVDKQGDDRKYIIFHQPGVTVEQARFNHLLPPAPPNRRAFSCRTARWRI